MSKYTKQDIIRMVEDEDVEFIRLQFTDMFGTLKNVAVTSSQLEKALNNECMFDGSSIEGFVRIEESDMYLYPDLSTLEISPGDPNRAKCPYDLRCISSQRTAFRGRSSLCVKACGAAGRGHGIYF